MTDHDVFVSIFLKLEGRKDEAVVFQEVIPGYVYGETSPKDVAVVIQAQSSAWGTGKGVGSLVAYLVVMFTALFAMY